MSLGFVVASDIVVRLGGLATLVGAVAVRATAIRAARQPGRGRWTTELGWHEFTTASLLASTAWFAIGVGAAASGAVIHGASASAWSLPVVGVPLVVGGLLQALVASATHLVPTLRGATPGARSRLGRAARLRVVAWQVATAGTWVVVAVPLDGPFGIVTEATLGVAVMTAVLLLTSALVGDRRAARRQPSA